MIQLRPVENKDSLFIESVFRSSREEELNLTNWTEDQKQTFIILQSMAQLADYNSKFPGATYEIIIYKKKDAGRFYWWENNSEIRLIDITLLPQFRGKGIGTFILKDLIKKSISVGKKISLHVIPENPALQLYKRLGFVYIKNNGRYYYLERCPER